MPTMRELMNATLGAAEDEALDIDVSTKDENPYKLMAFARRLDLLSDRIEDAINALIPVARPIDEDAAAAGGVSADTVRKRAERDQRRRDQLCQLTKKQSSIRAAMGT